LTAHDWSGPDLVIPFSVDFYRVITFVNIFQGAGAGWEIAIRPTATDTVALFVGVPLHAGKLAETAGEVFIPEAYYGPDSDGGQGFTIEHSAGDAVDLFIAGWLLRGPPPTRTPLVQFP
jgi:hypothetical protein